MGEFKYIIVDGLVKTGKTRLARIVAQEFSGRLILDNKENPFTEGFFTALAKGESSNFLKAQMIFLLNRYAQQLEIKQKGLFHKTTITDYIFYRDGIYAHTILNDEDLTVYKKMFNLFAQNVAPADLVIYLQVSFTEMLRRIQEVGTDLEKKVPNDYWREIFEAYNYYFFNFKSAPLLVVNMEKINLDRQVDVQHLLKEINNHKKGTIYYAPA